MELEKGARRKSVTPHVYVPLVTTSVEVAEPDGVTLVPTRIVEVDVEEVVSLSPLVPLERTPVLRFHVRTRMVQVTNGRPYMVEMVPRVSLMGTRVRPPSWALSVVTVLRLVGPTSVLLVVLVVTDETPSLRRSTAVQLTEDI